MRQIAVRAGESQDVPGLQDFDKSLLTVIRGHQAAVASANLWLERSPARDSGPLVPDLRTPRGE